MVVPQEHLDENKAPSPGARGCQGQEQEGSRWTCHLVPDVIILFMTSLRSSFEGLPKQDPSPKRIRTEKTLTENTVVLI